MSENWKEQIEQALREWESSRSELRQKTAGKAGHAQTDEAKGAGAGEPSVSFSMGDILNEEELSLLLSDADGEVAEVSQVDHMETGDPVEGEVADYGEGLDEEVELPQVERPHEGAGLAAIERLSQEVLREREAISAEVDVAEGSEERLQPGEWNEAMQLFCRHKADDFALMGYENIDEATLQSYIEHKYGQERPRLHRLAHDVMSLQVNQVMNWLTAKAYKGEAL